MALFTDGPPSTIEDLAAQDSQILDAASVEGIDLTRKLALAHEVEAMDLEAALRGGGANLRLENIVATPALRLWNTYLALEMAYADAYHNQWNDRYAKKRDQFSTLARTAYERLRLTGIGIAPRPVRQAATPEVEPAAGSMPNGTYYVTMTWTNSAGEEGASAIPEAISVIDSGFLVRPARGAGCGAAEQTWNVYAGATPETMTRQNGAALEAGAVWTQSGPLTIEGGAPGRGQAPSYYHVLPRMLQRG